MTDIELLREFRVRLKSKGDLRGAHVIHNAIQFIQRKRKVASEQRISNPASVDLHRSAGEGVRAKPAVVPSKHAADSAARKLQERTAREDAKAARHAEILRRIRAGEKRYLIASEMHVSEGTVARLAKEAGIPRPSRYTNVRNTTKE